MEEHTINYVDEKAKVNKYFEILSISNMPGGAIRDIAMGLLKLSRNKMSIYIMRVKGPSPDTSQLSKNLKYGYPLCHFKRIMDIQSIL